MSEYRLTAATLKGIWAGVTLPWREDYTLDEDVFGLNLARLCACQVHGIYTTGSTGEFYALDWPEFQRLVTVFMACVRPSGIPVQIGCCAADTRSVLRQIEFAGAAGADGVQIVIPFWMELTPRELRQYFRDVAAASSGLPLIHYNIPRAKHYLLGPDYRRLLDVAPNLIGVKFTFAGSHFAALQEALQLTPELAYFVGEDLLVSAMQLGARGSYSSLVCMNPAYMQRMYSLGEAGRWDEALQMQARLAGFFRGLSQMIADEDMGGIDPVVDKGLGVGSGFVLGHQRTRPPYIGWSDDQVQRVRAWITESYPELLYA